MTTHTIDQLAGIAYRTLDGGGSDRPPVLLIHGGEENAELLDAQAHDLADRGRRVIWYDRRGTGSSTVAIGPTVAPSAMPRTRPRC